MNHVIFEGTHYDAGREWGCLLRKNGTLLDCCPTFQLTEERRRFAAECAAHYTALFPEILDEIQGIADGNQVPVETLQTILFSMYCFAFDNKCTCFAVATGAEILFARNSDFQVSLEELYLNCLYRLRGSHAFTGNTTAFVELEDGVNQHGLAVGLTFVYPRVRKPGFNAGLLTRYLLEKCKTTREALEALRRLPIASSQTLTIADADGDIAVVECNPETTAVIKPCAGRQYVVTANNFNSEKLKGYRNPAVDDLRSDERFQTALHALEQNAGRYSVDFAKELLSGKYGFLCQYNRKYGADTVWSVVYDLKRRRIWRAEGNPGRTPYQQDTRFLFD